MGECLIIRSGGGTDTSDATATADVILSGYTAYVNDELITGRMPVQSLNQTLSPGGSVTLPAGYYEEGENVISVSTLAEETAANAASSRILSGYNGWVNGGLVQGSMANWGNTGATLAANGSYTIPAGWHAGAGVVNQSLAIHWGGTYTPNTGNQVMCWAGWYTGGNIIVAGASTLTAGNIRNGITIFGIRGTFTGWVDSATGWKNFTTKRLDAEVGTWGYYTPAIFMWYNGIPSTRGWKYIEINFNATMPTSISYNPYRSNEDFTNIGYNGAKIDLYFREHFWQNTITQNPILIEDGIGYRAPETYDFWNTGSGSANGRYPAIKVGRYAEENYGVRWRDCGITMNETTVQSFSVTPIKTYTNVKDRVRWVVTYDLYFKDSLSGSSLEWNDSSNPRQFLTWIVNYIDSYTIDDLPRVNTARFRFTK